MEDMKPVAFSKEKTAWAPFYAVDAELGLVAVSALTTARELGLRIAAQLVGGQTLLLEDGTALKRQSGVEIPWPDGESSYRAAYTRNHPHRLKTEIGYETCVLHRDATVEAAAQHYGYVLRFSDDDDEVFEKRFFHQWGRVTELPARPGWTDALWGMGLKMGLITPLDAFGCEGWRIDPRWQRPEDEPGWRQVLELVVGLYE